jgi:cellulose synthase/poly-beta-1,6-N-acetylglucosamine synthase-like glycosyltransferase
MLSAALPRWRGNLIPVAILGLLPFAAIAAAPAATAIGFEILLTALFLAWLGLRLTGVFVDPVARNPSSDMTDAELPIYTVIAALYHEAASIDGLLRAIERLDYPVEKLDVIFAVEADDRETSAAIAARKSRIPVTVITVPDAGHHTAFLPSSSLSAAMRWRRWCTRCSWPD